MTTQQTQQITAEQQVVLLKAQMFDMTQVQQQLQGQVQELSGAIQEIVNIAQIQGNEQGQVTLEDVVKTVAALVDDNAPVEALNEEGPAE